MQFSKLVQGYEKKMRSLEDEEFRKGLNDIQLGTVFYEYITSKEDHYNALLDKGMRENELSIHKTK